MFSGYNLHIANLGYTHSIHQIPLSLFFIQLNHLIYNLIL
jgi:hypothetical protein